MELLDAIEELERPVTRPSGGAAPQQSVDFVERQVLYVQLKLRELWQRKRGISADSPRLPFYWVFTKFLRLIEAYPDGLTEAVVVTELAKLLEQKEAGVGVPRKRRKIRDDEDMGDLLAEGEQEALVAKVANYGNHRITIVMENAKDVMAYM
uniref:Cell division control protein 24 OB domain-containing protein n=2 Tax=Phytophthora ramorum TaxID=164328 RepID=H3H4P3_PHYRM